MTILVTFESFKMAAIFKMATIVPRNISNGMRIQIDHCGNFAWNDVNKRSTSAQYFNLIYLRACDKWKFSTSRGQSEGVLGSSSANEGYGVTYQIKGLDE